VMLEAPLHAAVVYLVAHALSFPTSYLRAVVAALGVQAGTWAGFVLAPWGWGIGDPHDRVACALSLAGGGLVAFAGLSLVSVGSRHPRSRLNAGSLPAGKVAIEPPEVQDSSRSTSK
jgi:hypothetical protein